MNERNCGVRNKTAMSTPREVHLLNAIAAGLIPWWLAIATKRFTGAHSRFNPMSARNSRDVEFNEFESRE